MRLKKTFGFIAMLLLATMVFAGLASAIPVTIEKVEVNDEVVTVGATNLLDIERGDVVDVDVKITATSDVDDMEVEAFISGYEYNDFDRVSDTTPAFDADANVTYVKRLKLKLPDDVDEDHYRLRVLVTDRSGDEILQNYELKIDIPRHSMKIEDVFFYPSTYVKAGDALMTTARLRNFGEKDEKDVRVEVAVPELGISAVDYIDEVEYDEEEETEEMFLRIPKCTKAGEYTLKVIANYDRKHDKTSMSVPIHVSADESCETGTSDVKSQPKTLITVGSQQEDIMQGQEGAIFPITLTNEGSASRTYTLTVQAGNWAETKVSPTNTIVLGAGKSQALYVYVGANKDAPTGPQMVTATVSSGSETLEQITLTANVKEREGKGWDAFKKFLEVAVIVLVVVLVVVFLVIGFRKLKEEGDEEEPEAGQQTYY